jgi:hypothetical protein
VGDNATPLRLALAHYRPLNNTDGTSLNTPNSRVSYYDVAIYFRKKSQECRGARILIYVELNRKRLNSRYISLGGDVPTSCFADGDVRPSGACLRQLISFD